jgi:DNA-binding transcriptional MerR regulator
LNRRILVKTGELAKQAGVLPSTIRFYVQEGLLHPIDQTPGGYRLFDQYQALERFRMIEELQTKERLTLTEIKERLVSDSDSSSEDKSLLEI